MYKDKTDLKEYCRMNDIKTSVYSGIFIAILSPFFRYF